MKTNRMPFLILGVILFFYQATFSQSSNVYTFPGPDVDLGQTYLDRVISGQHYIGGRGDTIYVLRQFGHTYCHKSIDGGRTFGLGVRVNSTPSGAVNASLRVDTAGVVYVAYQGYSEADIFFTKSTDGGQTFAPAVKVNDDTIPQTGQEKPSIAVNDKGQIFIAWVDKRLATWTVFTSASFDSGKTFEPNVNVDSVLQNRLGPDIAADDAGKVYVVYAELLSNVYQISEALSRDSGQSFSVHTLVSDLPNNGDSCCATDASIALDATGLAGVAWWESRNDSVTTLPFSVSNNFGETFSPSIFIDSSGYPQFPSLTWNNGLFYVAWRAKHRRTPSGPDLDHMLFSYSRDSGKTFVPYVDAVPDDTNFVPHFLPTIWVNEHEKAFVAWSDARWDPWFEEDHHLFVSVGVPKVSKGDLDFDGKITFVDIVMELNAIFHGDPFPAPYYRADTNCDWKLTAADMVTLLYEWYLDIPFPCN